MGPTPKTLLFFLFVPVFLPFLCRAQTLSSVDIDTSFLLELTDSAKTWRDSLTRMDSLNRADTVEYRARDLIYNYPKKIFSLNHKALLRYQGTELEADTILFDQEKALLEAWGNPKITDKSNPPLRGMRMKYNMRKRIGQVNYGSSYRDKQQFNGMEIRRLEDGRLLIARGDFSTCNNLEHQHYYFYSRRLVVKPKEKIVARPVVLNIGDVPIAVLPMLVNPLESGRQSGLLMPRFGGDQKQGFFIKGVGAYWAINDYMDLSLKSDVVEGPDADFSATSAISEFRYKKRYLLDGHLNSKVFVKELSPENMDWDVDYAHKQYLSPDKRTELSGTGSFVSRSSIRRDNALEQKDVLNQQANANMTFTRRFRNNASLLVSARREQNLSNGYRVIQLPDATFRISGPVFPRDEFEEADTLAEPKWYNKLNYSYNLRGNSLRRVRVDSVQQSDTTWSGFQDKLSLTYNGQLWDVINLTPNANWEGNWSNQSYGQTLPDSSREIFEPKRFPDNYGDYFYRYNVGVGAETKLYGIWKPEIGSFTGIRHTVIPGLAYTIAPELDSNRHFVRHPLLHSTPYQAEQQKLSMSLGNDFDLKILKALSAENDSLQSQSSRDDYLNLKILDTRSSTSYNFAADSMNWSDISSSAGIQITPSYRFRFNMSHTLYDIYHPDPAKRKVVTEPILKSYNYGLNHTLRWSGDLNTGFPAKKDGSYEYLPWSANIDYSYGFRATRVSRTVLREDVTHTASARAELKPTRFWKIAYNTRFNFREGRFSEHVFSIDRDLHCWRMTFRWTPVGATSGWSFNIFVVDLPDIKFPMESTKILRKRQ